MSAWKAIIMLKRGTALTKINAILVSGLALASTFALTAPAYATIDNTVTVTGTAPDATTVTATDTENVDVQNLNPVLTNSSVTFSKTTGAVVGDVITATYVYSNTGNATLTNIQPTISFDGNNTATALVLVSFTNTSGQSADTGTDTKMDKLAPGDTVTYKRTYTINQTDMNTWGGTADGKITATNSATYAYTGSTGSLAAATNDIGLAPRVKTLSVAKTGKVGGVAVNGTSDNVAVGTVVTYEYVVTNTGNTTLTNVAISDSHNGSGTAPAPNLDVAVLTDNGTTGDSPNTTGDAKWNTLAPGDSLKVTATYTVTQTDIENRQ